MLNLSKKLSFVVRKISVKSEHLVTPIPIPVVCKSSFIILIDFCDIDAILSFSIFLVKTSKDWLFSHKFDLSDIEEKL